jgi:hypothetical protein
MLKWWTIGRATGVGAVSGVAALLLWPFFVSYGEPLLIPYVTALSLTAFAGASILWITASDLIFHRQRGERLIPLRVFDIALGLLLAVPSATTSLALLDLKTPFTVP